MNDTFVRRVLHITVIVMLWALVLLLTLPNITLIRCIIGLIFGVVATIYLLPIIIRANGLEWSDEKYISHRVFDNRALLLDNIKINWERNRQWVWEDYVKFYDLTRSEENYYIGLLTANSRYKTTRKIDKEKVRCCLYGETFEEIEFDIELNISDAIRNKIMIRNFEHLVELNRKEE